MKKAINGNKSPILLVSLIVAAAALMASTSYQFFNDSARRTIDIAAGEDRTSAKILSHELAISLANKLEGIEQNLQVIGQSPTVQKENINDAKALLTITQNTSSDMTDFYGWSDRDGKMIAWISNSAAGENLKTIGSDVSAQNWFIRAKDTMQSYTGAEMDTFDGKDWLFISYPVLSDSMGNFKGVIFAGVSLEKINGYLGSQLLPEKQITIMLVDMKGTVLQSEHSDLIGMNYFSAEYQRAIADTEKADDTGGLQKFTQSALGAAATTITSTTTPIITSPSLSTTTISSTSSSSSDTRVADFSFAGQPASIAYSHVRIGNANFAVVFTKVPHVIAANVEALIDQQRLASIVRIVVIIAAATIIGILVLSWNSKLKKIVAARTKELHTKTSELLSVNEQLERNKRLQKEFIDIAAHELRTPITPILTSIETVEHVKGPWNDDTLILPEESYRMLLRNIRRLERLSSDILHVARIESGTFELIKEKFDLNKLISDVVVDTDTSLPDSKRDIAIVFEPDHHEGELTVVEADQTKIYEVVTNLVQNAIKFTKEGKITISTERKNEDENGGFAMVVVSVKDMGSGIAPEILPRLFQKFASASSSQGLGGTGLGLYVSKNIVEAHGGKIWAQNNADGKGATFSFSIPLPR